MGDIRHPPRLLYICRAHRPHVMPPDYLPCFPLHRRPIPSRAASPTPFHTNAPAARTLCRRPSGNTPIPRVECPCLRVSIASYVYLMDRLMRVRGSRTGAVLGSRGVEHSGYSPSAPLHDAARLCINSGCSSHTQQQRYVTVLTGCGAGSDEVRHPQILSPSSP